MINKRKFDLYLALVHRSGVHEDIEARLRPAGRGGRPRALRVDVLLAAMMATVGDNRSLWLTQVHLTMTRELSRGAQATYGLRVGTDAVTIRQVRYLVSAIASAYDDSTATQPDLDPLERAERTELLDSIVNRIISVTSDHLDPTHRYAVDATSIAAFAKGKGRGVRGSKATRNKATKNNKARKAKKPAATAVTLPTRSADRDASWGHRTATYGDRSTMFFGWHLTSFVRVDKVGVPKHSQPMLTERILLNPANKNDVPCALGALDRIEAEIGPVLEILADRGYSDKKVLNWARPLRERGIDQVFDMMPADHGSRPQKDHGYVMLDGWPHDPSVPERLRRIERPPVFTVVKLREDAPREDRAEYERRLEEINTFNALIAERRLYAYERIAFGRNGAVRFRCPGSAGKLRTQGCLNSAGLPADRPHSVHPAGIPAPTACKQATIQIRATVEEKLRQRHYWGSPEWQKAYARRTAVERTFGLMKSRSLQRGWMRLTGRVKTFFMVAIAVVVNNLCILTSWAAETGDRRDPMTQLDLTDYGFEEYDPAGRLASGVPPPAT